MGSRHDFRGFIHFSDISAKDFVCGMLTIDPAHRLTASELLDHPWITVRTPSVSLQFCVYLVPAKETLCDAHSQNWQEKNVVKIFDSLPNSHQMSLFWG